MLAEKEHWSRVAAEWVAWAREPDHDAFWAYRDALTEYLGTGSGDALDVGCGEGRVSRVLTSRGYTVTAVDPVAELLSAAEEARSAQDYVVASAGELPFEDGRFALVVSYNMLMDVADVPAAVKEMKRVLREDGTLFVSVVHPLADLELVKDQVTYFDRRRFETKVEDRGLTMKFAGWAQPLEAYAGALESAGLAITSVKEPAADIRDGRQHLEHWARFPLFLWLKARPLP
ncbi:class I SAM-dependent methyltransferase [Amycolatopsis sp. NPDC059027]|uniref:class I SAM-dependent methyltransferase n=1 Tax=unclassified Amycolatopsis TaxID=2618356 RepID=UPI003670D718